METPKTQIAETLHLLINRKMMTTLAFEGHGILNPTSKMSELRKLGVEIQCEMKPKVNRFGRKVKFGTFRLKDEEEAINIYNKINK